MHPSFRDSISLRWEHSTRQFEPVPSKDLSWSIADAGTLYGAILVERFRTYAGKLLDLSDHKNRLNHGARQLTIDMSSVAIDWEPQCKQLIELNQDLVQGHGDVSIVLLLSPGENFPGLSLGTRPTCLMHLSQLPFAKLDKWYNQGTDLSIASQHAVPSTCWSNQIKSRSRLPYFLSDAKAVAEQSDALAVLTTTRGTISDTSVANLLMVDSKGGIASPPREDILVGCTLLAVEKLLLKNDVRIQYREIEAKELASASEIILTGSSGGVWFAGSLDGVRFGTRDRPMARMLTELWKKHVGMDYVAQAGKCGRLVGSNPNCKSLD